MQKLFVALMSIVFVSSCVKIPEGVNPVSNFEVDRYMGKWSEIARLDHRSERGLKAVTAEYSLNQDGGFAVKHRGYMTRQSEWQEVEGKASFAGPENIGHFKVSIVPPFPGSYAIFELDPDYQYAYVCGSNTSRLWLLARTTEVDQDILDDFVGKSKDLGFDTSELIYVHHF